MEHMHDLHRGNLVLTAQNLLFFGSLRAFKLLRLPAMIQNHHCYPPIFPRFETRKECSHFLRLLLFHAASNTTEGINKYDFDIMLLNESEQIVHGVRIVQRKSVLAEKIHPLLNLIDPKLFSSFLHQILRGFLFDIEHWSFSRLKSSHERNTERNATRHLKRHPCLFFSGWRRDQHKRTCRNHVADPPLCFGECNSIKFMPWKDAEIPTVWVGNLTRHCIADNRILTYLLGKNLVHLVENCVLFHGYLPMSRLTASLKGTPSLRITKSMTSPCAPQPKQWKVFSFLKTTKDGVLSS